MSKKHPMSTLKNNFRTLTEQKDGKKKIRSLKAGVTK